MEKGKVMGVEAAPELDVVATVLVRVKSTPTVCAGHGDSCRWPNVCAVRESLVSRLEGRAQLSRWRGNHDNKAARYIWDR